MMTLSAWWREVPAAANGLQLHCAGCGTCSMQVPEGSAQCQHLAGCRHHAVQQCTNTKPSVTAACSLQVLRAIKDGCDCRGIYIWTLVNNFVSTCCCPRTHASKKHVPLESWFLTDIAELQEWAEGYTKPFGL